MERVTGIGGVFFKAKDPKALAAWYREQLGVEMLFEHGASFKWKDGAHPDGSGSTAWSIFSADTKYFAPSSSAWMINYRVPNLDRMLEQLRKNGVTVDDKIDASDFGRFGWAMDPEGNRIELWEPPLGM